MNKNNPHVCAPVRWDVELGVSSGTRNWEGQADWKRIRAGIRDTNAVTNQPQYTSTFHRALRNLLQAFNSIW